MSMFVYTSKCCNATATKKPCVKPKDKEDFASLGTWKCPSCGKKCSVTRTKNVEKN